MERERPSPFNQLRQLHRHAGELRGYAEFQHSLLLRLHSPDLAWLVKDHIAEGRVVIEYYREANREPDVIVARARMMEDSLASRTRSR